MSACDAVAHRVIRGTATSSLKLGEERIHRGHRISVEIHPEQKPRQKIFIPPIKAPASLRAAKIRPSKSLSAPREAGQAGVLLQQDVILPGGVTCGVDGSLEVFRQSPLRPIQAKNRSTTQRHGRPLAQGFGSAMRSRVILRRSDRSGIG